MAKCNGSETACRRASGEELGLRSGPCQPWDPGAHPRARRGSGRASLRAGAAGFAGPARGAPGRPLRASARAGILASIEPGAGMRATRLTPAPSGDRPEIPAQPLKGLKTRPNALAIPSASHPRASGDPLDGGFAPAPGARSRACQSERSGGARRHSARKFPRNPLKTSKRARVAAPQCATSSSPRRSGLKRITMTIATATTPATSASAKA